MEKICEKIGAYLLQSGHTQAELAKQLDITPATLKNKILGKTEWTWEQVLKLSEILECELQEFK